MRCPGAMAGFLPVPGLASSASMSSSPAKPSRWRCLRSLVIDATPAFFVCAFSFSRSAITCFAYRFWSRCLRLQQVQEVCEPMLDVRGIFAAPRDSSMSRLDGLVSSGRQGVRHC